MKFFITLIILFSCFKKTSFCQSNDDSLNKTFFFAENDSVGSKYVQKTREHIATLIVTGDSAFEYFYSNSRFLLKYSIGKTIHQKGDTVLLKSDISYIKRGSSLIKDNKFCHQYNFQEFNNKVLLSNKSKIVELSPYLKKNSRKSLVKISTLIHCCSD